MYATFCSIPSSFSKTLPNLNTLAIKKYIAPIVAQTMINERLINSNDHIANTIYKQRYKTINKKKKEEE